MSLRVDEGWIINCTRFVMCRICIRYPGTTYVDCVVVAASCLGAYYYVNRRLRHNDADYSMYNCTVGPRGSYPQNNQNRQKLMPRRDEFFVSTSVLECLAGLRLSDGNSSDILDE
jgi:hypothetical protein